MFVDEQLRKDLGRRALRHAQRYFGLQKAVSDLANVYYYLTGGHAQKPTRTSYGFLELGFFFAGRDSEYPFEYIHTGEIPDSFNLGLVKKCLPKVEAFWDIGANSGLYTFEAAAHAARGTRFFAFEPRQECCDAMTATVELNSWEDAVVICPLGLSDREGVLELHLSETGSTFRNEFNDNAPNPVRQVRVDTIDRLKVQLGCPRIDFVKIDVEGFELNVLKGGAKSIKIDRPILFVEIADSVEGRKFRNPDYVKTLQWLWDRGYVLFRSDGAESLKKVRRPREESNVAMYLCLNKVAHVDLIRYFTWFQYWLIIKRAALPIEKLILETPTTVLRNLRNGHLPFERTMRRWLKKMNVRR